MGSQQHLHKLLTAAGGPLAQLLQTSRERDLLLAEVRRYLPAELAAAVHSAALEDGCLRLGVSGGVWAARLRFLAPQLRQRLAAPSAGWSRGMVQAVEVHVTAPATTAAAPAPAAPRVLSAASRRHLRAVADGVADARLAAALRALADSGAAPDEG
ncbi:DciA family protein [Immundisolibacter sp.]|uniref:DciA family protein n=1 Tax=Immundisolibacter sp. TaxID=1934948 RepID=UPI00262B98FB|nr:DciA family protein [Immundisolibacter sp.]MDD3651942.1 DciA family protein [Immundisolibacter sp.]